MGRTCRRLASLAVPLLLACLQPAGAADPADIGRRIYAEGVTAAGQPLQGARAGGLVASGREVACIQCHRRSGFGGSEGRTLVPPVIGPALFGAFERPSAARPRHASGMGFRDFPHIRRPVYDAGTLARALREGIASDGRPLHYLMPRYALSDADVAGLTAYLETLTAEPSPGAEGGQLHLATVVAPGIDPAREREALGVLRACVAERQPARGGGDAWQLHTWRLQGAPESWGQQLQEHYRRQPVFALLGGLAGGEWHAVHRFCESGGIPCLFPDTLLPGDGRESVYNFYYSRGTLLEADVLAGFLREGRERLGLRRVVQVSPAAGPGAAAAAALREALAQAALPLTERRWEAGGKERARLARELSSLGAGDALVLWLPAQELARLQRRLPRPPAGVQVFVSALLAGVDRPAVTAPWRGATRLIYPVEAPGRWALRARFNLRPWLARHGIAPGDERLQGSSLAACATFAEAVYRMQGLRVRELLLEQVEQVLSAAGNSGATAAYPRVLLGPEQRFASKGAYVVRFDPAKPGRLEPESGWIVP